MGDLQLRHPGLAGADKPLALHRWYPDGTPTDFCRDKGLGRNSLTPCSFVGSPGRIRTIDPAVNSRLLYH
jgi:hypothetical protein